MTIRRIFKFKMFCSNKATVTQVVRITKQVYHIAWMRPCYKKCIDSTTEKSIDGKILPGATPVTGNCFLLQTMETASWQIRHGLSSDNWIEALSSHRLIKFIKTGIFRGSYSGVPTRGWHGKKFSGFLTSKLSDLFYFYFNLIIGN